jgi:hypothetical protein
MYWRVRNLGPEHLVRQYGVHAGLVASILFNVLLVVTRPNPHAGVIGQAKKNFELFARQVTSHLLDSSYITYDQSTAALLGGGGVPGELHPNVIQQLKQIELLPKSAEEMEALKRQLGEERRVSAVRIDSVVPGEPDKNGLIPVTVSGIAAFHSASGSEDPHPFKFQYLMGLTGKTPEEQKPIVADFHGQ